MDNNTIQEKKKKKFFTIVITILVLFTLGMFISLNQMYNESKFIKRYEMQGYEIVKVHKYRIEKSEEKWWNDLIKRAEKKETFYDGEYNKEIYAYYGYKNSPIIDVMDTTNDIILVLIKK